MKLIGLCLTALVFGAEEEDDRGDSLQLIYQADPAYASAYNSAPAYNPYPTPVAYNPPAYNPPAYNPPAYNPPPYNPPVYNTPPPYNPPVYNTPPPYNPPVYNPPSYQPPTYNTPKVYYPTQAYGWEIYTTTPPTTTTPSFPPQCVPLEDAHGTWECTETNDDEMGTIPDGVECALNCIPGYAVEGAPLKVCTCTTIQYPNDNCEMAPDTGAVCVEQDECELGTHNCSLGSATCTNTDGSFTCACNDGYVGDGTNCHRPEECELGNPCQNGGGCLDNWNEETLQFDVTCDCPPMFGGEFCEIVECAEVMLSTENPNVQLTMHTDSTAVCLHITTPPGHGIYVSRQSCSDFDLYIFDGVAQLNTDNLASSLGAATEALPCSLGPITRMYDSNDMSVVFVDLTSARRRKRDLPETTITFSLDVNECWTDANNCHRQATCVNNFGGFGCVCNEGFSGDGELCLDSVVYQYIQDQQNLLNVGEEQLTAAVNTANECITEVTASDAALNAKLDEDELLGDDLVEAIAAAIAQSMIDDEPIVTQLEAEVAAIDAQIDSLQIALAQEIADREAADLALTNRITAANDAFTNFEAGFPATLAAWETDINDQVIACQIANGPIQTEIDACVLAVTDAKAAFITNHDNNLALLETIKTEFDAQEIVWAADLTDWETYTNGFAAQFTAAQTAILTDIRTFADQKAFLYVERTTPVIDATTQLIDFDTQQSAHGLNAVAWTATSNQFTIPISGYYYFRWNVKTLQDAGATVSLRKSKAGFSNILGGQIGVLHISDTDRSGEDYFSQSIYHWFEAGDVVELSADAGDLDSAGSPMTSINMIGFLAGSTSYAGSGAYSYYDLNA